MFHHYTVKCNVDGEESMLYVIAKTKLYAAYEARDILKRTHQVTTLPNSFIEIGNERWYIV